MKRQLIWLAIGMAALTLACGGSDDGTTAQAPPSEATTETEAAKAPAAEAETPDVAAPPQDAAKQCLALAAQQKWSEALDPCRQAAKEQPTDLRIKHAVQQAEAAAAG